MKIAYLGLMVAISMFAQAQTNTALMFRMGPVPSVVVNATIVKVGDRPIPHEPIEVFRETELAVNAAYNTTNISPGEHLIVIAWDISTNACGQVVDVALTPSAITNVGPRRFSLFCSSITTATLVAHSIKK